MNGRLALFRNFDEYDNQLARPHTLLIDSEQLESGDALDKNFRAMAASEIDRFRYEMKQRGDHRQAENISDQDLLREVMNTVGKEDRRRLATRYLFNFRKNDSPALFGIYQQSFKGNTNGKTRL